MTLKMIDPAQAASLYAKNAIAGEKQVSGGDGVSFSDFLKQNVSEAIDVVKEGEKMSAKAITGQADLADVVQAVSQSELTIQTAIAIRDRMLSAYQEIIRMPI